MPRAAAAWRCASSALEPLSRARASRRSWARWPRSPRRSASASSPRPTATRCSRWRAPARPRTVTRARRPRCAVRSAPRSPALDEPARRTAELAAVAGRPLDRAELAALAPPEAVLAAMDCGLFRSADGRFGFRHDLLREAALADLDDARRGLLHETLGQRAGARAAEAARHLRLAGRDDLAAGRLVAGGRRSRAGDRARRGGGLPRGGGRAAPGRPADPAAAGREARGAGTSRDALAALEAAVALIDPATSPPCRCPPARRDLVPQRAVRPDAARAAPPSSGSRRSTAAARRCRGPRGVAADPGLERGHDRRARAPPTPRSPSSTRSGSTSRRRRCGAITSTPCAASRCSRKGACAEAEAVLVASGEAGERAGPRRPRLRRMGERGLHRLRPRRARAGARVRAARRGAGQRRPDHRLPHGLPARLHARASRDATTRRAPRTTARPSWRRGSPRRSSRRSPTTTAG